MAFGKVLSRLTWPCDQTKAPQVNYLHKKYHLTQVVHLFMNTIYDKDYGNKETPKALQPQAEGQDCQDR